MRQELEASLFDLAVKELPPDYVTELLRILPLIYQGAYSGCFEEAAWDEPEAHDLFGHVRRALTEASVRRVAKQFGLMSEPFPNERRTAYYTLIRAGRLVMTVSAIQHESQMARPARFRSQNAAVNRVLAQPTLTELDIHSPDLFASGEVYSILFHGPQPQNPKALGFVALGFPDAESHRPLFKFPLTELAKAQAFRPHINPIGIEDGAQPKWKQERKKGDA